jgi:site-specific DNA recombinase
MRVRPASEWIPITVPALVSEETFRAAQTQLDQNRARQSGRPPARCYLLRGLLRCAGCGRKYIGTPSHGRRIYRCAGRDRLTGEARCRAATRTAEPLESLVWDAIVGALRQPALLEAKLESNLATLGARDVEVRSRVEHLGRQLADLERREAKLLDLYLEDGIEAPTLRTKLEAIRQQKTQTEEQRAEAQRHVATQSAAAGRQQAIRDYCRLALRGLTKLTPEGRQRLLGALVDQIVLRDDHMEIHGVMPGRSVPSLVHNWTDSQEIVSPCRRDLEGALGPDMPPHIGEIEPIRVEIRAPAGGPGPIWRDVTLTI